MGWGGCGSKILEKKTVGEDQKILIFERGSVMGGSIFPEGGECLGKTNKKKCIITV